jgi:general secretion pathway protein G
VKNLRGFTLIELLIVVAIIAILAAIAVPNFLEAQTRSKVTRVRSDHRSLATAIETYYIDQNEYPACTNDDQESFDAKLVEGITDVSNWFGCTFMSSETDTRDLNTLTTPIAYITSIFPDPFADTNGMGFRYFTDSRGWILGSFGPDVDQIAGGDLAWNDVQTLCGGAAKYRTGGVGVETAYDSGESQPSATLLTGGATGSEAGQGAFTYDPTNGTVSHGDVWRVKQ